MIRTQFMQLWMAIKWHISPVLGTKPGFLRPQAAHSVDKLPLSGRARHSSSVFIIESNLVMWYGHLRSVITLWLWITKAWKNYIYSVYHTCTVHVHICYMSYIVLFQDVPIMVFWECKALCMRMQHTAHSQTQKLKVTDFGLSRFCCWSALGSAVPVPSGYTTIVIEGSLEVKLPTLWTVEKQRWEESEEKRSEERRCRCAKR